jgi:hypothetical protein
MKTDVNRLMRARGTTHSSLPFGEIPVTNATSLCSHLIHEQRCSSVVPKRMATA